MQRPQRELEIDKRIAEQCIRKYYSIINELIVEVGKIVGDENIGNEFYSLFSPIGTRLADSIDSSTVTRTCISQNICSVQKQLLPYAI